MNYYTTEKTLDNGYTVKVGYDEYPESPREWDNAGIVVLSDRCRYDFGDERASAEELRAIMENPANIALPVYMYDHSGITINTGGFSCGWDSGIVGCIYIPKAEAVKEWGKKLCTAQVQQKARDYLRAEIETLDQYITGTVYFYEVLDRAGDCVDSCSGFYGPESYCLTEAEAAANYLAHQQDTLDAKEAAESRYWAERDCLTVTA